MPKPANAFTLIELLVVITIIVVLLSLLTPALDRAIYQAELASCGARLKATATAGATYAIDQNRLYPARPAADQPADFFVAGYDWRPQLRPYFSINGMFNCPLTGDLDYDLSRATDGIWINYNVWYGFWYGSGQRLSRLGDRFSVPVAENKRFAIAAADRDLVMPGRPEIQSSHPDSNGYTSLFSVQDGQAPWGQGNATISMWWTTAGAARGTVDLNFAATDVSVIRKANLLPDDPDMVKIPVWRNQSEFPTSYTMLPPS